MPHFRKGYDERLDLTEEEYYERLYYDSEGEYDHDGDRACEAALDGLADVFEVWAETAVDDLDIEGEPYEDSYLPGIPDYDRFGRPSWEIEEA